MPRFIATPAFTEFLPVSRPHWSVLCFSNGNVYAILDAPGQRRVAIRITRDPRMTDEYCRERAEVVAAALNRVYGFDDHA